MKYFVKVTPRSSQARVEQTSPNTFHVWVHEPPVDGKANEAVIKAIAEYLGCSRSQVYLVAGHTSQTKLVEVERD